MKTSIPLQLITKRLFQTLKTKKQSHQEPQRHVKIKNEKC